MGFFFQLLSVLACGGVLYAKDCRTGGSCVSSCNDKADGVYQSCSSCSVFIVCINHELYEQSCLEGLVWDGNAKTCLAQSNTCKEANCLDNHAALNTVLRGALGNHVIRMEQMELLKQNKEFSRHHFPARAQSLPGEHASHRPGRCKTTGKMCVSDCTDVPDGDYQSCHGCGVYVSCVAGYRYDDRPCAPGGLVWDDDLKTCEWNSSTCHGCYCPDCPVPCHGTGPRCVGDCTGLADGDYQSCKGCDVYVSCVDGTRYDARPCAPGGTVWDDNKKLCDWYSDTCSKCPLSM